MDELAAKQVLLDFELITLIAMALGVAFYVLLRRMRRQGESLELIDYDMFDLVLMFFPAILFLMNPIVEAVMAASGTAKPVEPPKNDLLSIFVNIGYFAFVGIMTCGIIEWIRNRRVVDLFGLRELSFPKIVVISILGGVASLLICAWAVGEISNSYLEGIFGDLKVQEPVRMFQESKSIAHFSLSILMACIAAPVVEEFLFRGYMYGTLRRLTNPVFAAVIIGGLFAVVHGNLPALLPLWVFSILLCLAYEFTRCLWVPVGMHVFFNAANIVLMLMPESAE
ncbi:MAG: CPBP family intramembrane metalloprotease [Verrucomicrobiales bacterium]|jgi:membrane protease YdiL (CAAX protease family)|nr:CPBP family intramembrane metalloprotease [Verrucomicrobiales bacterium]MDP4791477.1 CPBP family intramembrane metalloprotease [Verrucomicrobiales bacterium]MDP5005934.1 CPBP family intramembrane metalloprotease [Verrucomicrobiales bacterium]